MSTSLKVLPTLLALLISNLTPTLPHPALSGPSLPGRREIAPLWSDQPWAPLDGRGGSGGRQTPTTCITIPSNMTLCQGMAYPMMRLPNLLGHETVREAVQQSKGWNLLKDIDCHPNTQVCLILSYVLI